MEVLHQVETSVLLAGLIGVVAIAASRLSRLVRLPPPAVFLLAGVLVAAVYGPAHSAATFERIATVGSYALIFILFEGGFSNGGWLRTGPCIRPILTLGLAGTLVTTALLTAACHYIVGLELPVSVLIAVALAPTDPAAVFSVLGEQDVSGTTDIILEGESGANDPVGISLMLGAIAYFQSEGSLGGVALDFVAQLIVASGVGILLGILLAQTLRRVHFGADALHVLAATAGAFLTFATATHLHGSGFLAVFIAGLVVGRHRLQAHDSTESFLAVLAALSEMAMFTVLGLTVVFAGLGNTALSALAIFGLLTFVIRPLVTAVALIPEDLSREERTFVAWGGLKGAVPILLASFPILAGLDSATTVYNTVFIAVVASVLLQGSTLPLLARRIGLLTPPQGKP